jgi:hypothetical protein
MQANQRGDSTNAEPLAALTICPLVADSNSIARATVTQMVRGGARRPGQRKLVCASSNEEWRTLATDYEEARAREDSLDRHNATARPRWSDWTSARSSWPHHRISGATLVMGDLSELDTVPTLQGRQFRA